MKELKIVEPNIFVIFGATGDLTYRKLMPAVYNLYIQDLLPKNFSIVCIGRREFSQEDYSGNVKNSIKEFSKNTFDEEKWKEFSLIFEYLKLDFVKDDTYASLKDLINNLCNKYGCSENIMYYMAVSPEYFSVIADKLNKNGLVRKDK